MSSPREYLENVREVYGPLFVVAPVEGGTEILFKGALLMMVERDERLPPGFYDRMIAHFMDLLTGRKSALWDEQAIFGDKPFDADASRRRAEQHSIDDEQQREKKP